MDIENRLDVVIITYNRKDYLKKTLDEILDENSPIKNCEITILDNKSDDGTFELINDYKEKFKNIIPITNTKNIGGNANIAKALVEIPKKEYVWVLCDNDTYNWQKWGEVQKAIEENYDVIITRKSNSITDIVYNSTLVSAAVYKTSNIDQTTAENIYLYIGILFPHLAAIIKNINDNNRFFSVSEDIVNIGINPNSKTSLTRGLELNELAPKRKNIFWAIGYYQALELLKDKKLRKEIIENTTCSHVSLFELFRTIIIKNKMFYNNYFDNYIQILRMFSFSQKLKFILAYLSVSLSLKDYSFYDIQYESEWKEYLKKINEQKYINKLKKKLKNKKIILYGAGLLNEIIINNYDLKGLNIVGISDKKFEHTNEKYFKNLKIIKPKELKNNDFDTIIFSIKLYKNIIKTFKKEGINKEFIYIIPKNIKYALRN